jgi:oligopeptidase A
MTNVLLEPTELPPFRSIRPELVEPALTDLLEACRKRLAQIVQCEEPSWSSVVEPIEAMQHRIARTWSPVGHLNAVASTDELRDAYTRCLPLLTAWHTDLGQNERLYAAYAHILSSEGPVLAADQRQLLEHALRDFRLAGVSLPPERKARFKACMEELATIQARFDDNVLDATNGWSWHTRSEERLSGLPAAVIARAAARSHDNGEEGWRLALDAPNYQAVLTHATDRDLRRTFYEAWTTRASDQGPDAGRWDNSALMERILALRYEIAQLAGFANFAEYSLATKMASTVPDVIAFLVELAARSRPVAANELAELESHAGQALEAWDIAFYSERMKCERLSVSEEALRPYFPLPRVLAGLFEVASRLYGIRIAERNEVETYHSDVRFFDVLDSAGAVRGSFFIDLYARPRKRGGAWMDECVGRKRLGAESSQPVAYLVCNFMPPGADAPSLLTHQEVVTLFHEFGHGLHHMLTQVDFPSIAGINGVPWDAVELPSQFMENFAWRSEVLPIISGHVDDGRPLPAAELERLQQSRTFHAGLQSVRQLEFALFDFRLHAEYDPARGARLDHILSEVRAEVAVFAVPEWNRFPHNFGHIFAGGYAAGYYSYKWAEVLSADVFAAFEEQGVFDRKVAQRFLDAILSAGGSRKALDAFIEFRGRPPDVNALLRRQGLVQ